MEEIIYPDLPPGYAWRVPKTRWKGEDVPGQDDDVDLLRADKAKYHEALVAFAAFNEDTETFQVQENGNAKNPKHYAGFPTLQDAVNHLHMMLLLGEFQ